MDLSFEFELCLQADNLVAILCSLEEVELFCGFLHLTGSLGNEFLHLRTGHVFDDRIGSS